MNLHKVPLTLAVASVALAGCGGSDDNTKNLTISADLDGVTAFTMDSKLQGETCNAIKALRGNEASPTMSNAISASNTTMCKSQEYTVTDTHLVIRGSYDDLETSNGVHKVCEVIIAPLGQKSDSVECLVEKPNDSLAGNVVRSIRRAIDGETLVLHREAFAEQGKRTFLVETWHPDTGFNTNWTETYNSSDIDSEFRGPLRTGFTYNGDHMYLDMRHNISPMQYVDQNGATSEYNSQIRAWLDDTDTPWTNYLEQDGLVFTSFLRNHDDVVNGGRQGGLLIDSQNAPVGDTGSIEVTPMRISYLNGSTDVDMPLGIARMGSHYNHGESLFHHVDEGIVFRRYTSLLLLRHGALLDAMQGEGVVDVEEVAALSGPGMPNLHATMDVNVAGGRYLYLYGEIGELPDPYIPDVLVRVNVDTMEIDKHNILSHELFDNMGAVLEIERHLTGLTFEITNHDGSITMAYLDQATGEVSATPPADVTPVRNFTFL